MTHDGIHIVVIGKERDPVAVCAGIVCSELVWTLRTSFINLHFVTPSMLNLRPATLEYEARPATSFFAAGSAATAEMKERTVASLMLLWIEMWSRCLKNNEKQQPL